MERILNDNEKIRKAEEIYYRRNNQNISMNSKQVEKKRGSFKDKIWFNLVIMFDIAIIIFCIQNKDFIFTTEFLGTIEKYNSELSSKVVDFLSGILNEKSEENNMNILNNDNKANIEDNSITNNEIDSNQPNDQSIQENNIGQNTSEIIIDNSSSMSEMDMDIENLKAAYSFVKPINGIVSSGFGARESEYQNVKGYHTGVDIAAEKGTIIKASMQGIVELVSSEGDYGNHVKIRCNNIITLYAHCSKIYVEEGQIVAQNQDIATVGSTGNSTGPHLHFEIRVEDRFVDPARIINL